MNGFTSFPEPGPHILLVDDSVEELRLLVEMLRGHDFRLSIANDGSQGYERAVASRPDLVLLDVRMPRMDGLTVARMLKANPQTETIPILFVTAATDVDDRLLGLREGAVDYIVKPFSAAEVVERVRIHLRLAAMLKVEKSRIDDMSQEGGSDEEVLVRAVRKHLTDKLSEPPRLADLAQAFGVPERRLSNAFRQCLGMSVFEYMRQERMRKAQKLLSQTGLSIETIAQEVGFSSAANFSTAFHNCVGTSPSAFRSQAFSHSPALGHFLQWKVCP